MPRYAYTREERQEQIRLVFQVDIDHGNSKPLTMYQIAKRLDMRPSTHLMGIILDMVVSKELTAESVPHRPKVTKRVFSLNTGQILTSQKKARTIVINPNRTNQMELMI